jgi:hypothetical protein
VDTWGLTLLAVTLGILIAAILLRKCLAAAGFDVPPLAASLRDSAGSSSGGGERSSFAGLREL